ncbi:hypothetical protein DYB31_011889 [Aphanomyces astaci]|uniref:FYVE-type domain-containing protein n=1 Tax=Aphanomyces astaci TaxID=112090 RepID=A0A397F5N9_APHAT|nr:hypothetical protein DYB31_011889 [Aphanomyces astaci]
MYEGWDPFTPNTSTLHAGTTEFIGHLDEVAAYYRTHHVKGHGVVADTHTLYTIVDTPTASVRVKWLATKTSSLDGFVAKKRRDFCVLEVKMFPSGVVCQDAARRGYLHLSAVAHIDVQGLVPPLVALRATKDMCRAFAGVELCLRQSRLSASAFLLARDLRPLDSRRDCFLCHRRFSPLRKKTNCLKCGEVVCTACNPSWSVLVNGHLTKRRACTLCSLACPVVKCVLLKADGSIEEVTVDMTPQKQEVKALLGGACHFLGQYEDIEVFLMCNPEAQEDESLPVTAQKMQPPFHGRLGEIRGDILIFRTDASGEQQDFTVEEYKAFQALTLPEWEPEDDDDDDESEPDEDDESYKKAALAYLTEEFVELHGDDIHDNIYS